MSVSEEPLTGTRINDTDEDSHLYGSPEKVFSSPLKKMNSSNYSIRHTLRKLSKANAKNMIRNDTIQELGCKEESPIITKSSQEERVPSRLIRAATSKANQLNQMVENNQILRRKLST